MEKIKKSLIETAKKWAGADPLKIEISEFVVEFIRGVKNEKQLKDFVQNLLEHFQYYVDYQSIFSDHAEDFLDIYRDIYYDFKLCQLDFSTYVIVGKVLDYLISGLIEELTF